MHIFSKAQPQVPAVERETWQQRRLAERDCDLKCPSGEMNDCDRDLYEHALDELAAIEARMAANTQRVAAIDRASPRTVVIDDGISIGDVGPALAEREQLLTRNRELDIQRSRVLRRWADLKWRLGLGK